MPLLRNRLVRTLLAFVISLPYPGLGHIFARRWNFGVALLAIASAGGIVFAILSSTFPPSPMALKGAGVAMGIGLLIALASAIDSARILWRRDEDVRPHWPRSTWFAALVAIAISGAVGAAFPRHWRAFSIPSAAMIPTLLVGDNIMADTRPFAPARGDIVLFCRSGDADTVFIKRVVGLSGETVQMKGGRLYIDGAMVAREPIAESEIAGARGGTRLVPTYRETPPGGAAYDIVEIDGDTGFLDDTALFAIPPGQYFVLGDNRDNSTDSRLAIDKGGVGFVQAKDIIGKAGAIFWSRDMSRIFSSAP